MRIVMKFGGVSVKDGENILHCANLVKKYAKDNEVVVVVSAMQGVTDSLLHAAHKCYKEASHGFIKLFIAELAKRHYDAIETAVKDKRIKEKVINRIDNLLDELEKILLGISYLGELTKRSEDYILSFGERLLAPIFSASLISLGVDSVALTGGDAGIVTDSNYGRAKPLPEVYSLIKSRIEPLISIKKLVPVVTGFIGVTKDGNITTLGRGGSDLTATLIAAAIDADEVWLWKEVDGVMTTDPKIVPEAKLIPELSYQEAMELSHFGAKILHPRAIEPVMKRKIPVRIKNTFNPEAEGTVIRDGITSTKDVVKALSLIEKVSIVNISGAGFDFAEIMTEVFRILAENKVNVVMVAQSSSELNLSIVIDDSDYDKAMKALKKIENGSIKVEGIRDVAVISAVGAGMAGTPGVAGRIFSTLGRNRINVRMISQSCSEYNISFAVSKNEGRKAVKVLHDEFIKKEE
ncbi:aspartate kinase [Ferroglobus placidus DSM 10642]|uniref:Aspartokinase n=1 Tax=Ferroglobus placidus (strain DSM 10642 / AEDII12DO) TaxID=589924 RepID=D3RWV9_FERPA|nr:aspartate kinase [Ferroglobus placidus]ADC64972.1 aspartate kinase [Ferroglobus placidus DSM 10642]